MQLKVKVCDKNSGWQPNVVPCNYTQVDYDLAKTDECPGDYIAITADICVLIHPKQPFESFKHSCDENLVPFNVYNMSAPELNSLFTFLRDYGPKLWLPAKQTNFNSSLQIGSRYTIDEIGLQWTQPAFLGERVILHDSCPTCSLEYQEGCLAFVPILNVDDRFNTSVINCNLNHLHSFCMFRKTDTLSRLACPSGYVAPLIPIHQNIECLAIRPFAPLNVTRVANDILSRHCPLHEAYQLNSIATTFNFELLAKQSSLSLYDRCLFGITPWQVAVTSSVFVDIFLANEHSFVNWDISMGLHEFNASSENHILSVNEMGRWFWENGTVSCIVCSEKVTFRMPSLELKYDSFQGTLRLQIFNGDFLLTRFTNKLKFMCFAKVHNQYSSNLKATLIFSNRDVLYDIDLIGPGNYWCIGHAIYLGNVIESERVFSQGIVMSMMVTFDCRRTVCYNFVNLFRRFLNDSFALSLNDTEPFQLEQISIHDDVEYETNFANILFRVTVHVLNEDALKTEENLLKLSDEMLMDYYIRQQFVYISNMQNETFRIRSVNSTNFCLPSSISQLTEMNWLGARINQIIESVERCADSTGRPIRRRCVGNARFGLDWQHLSPETECIREDSSDLTDDLQHLANSFEDAAQSEDIIEKVRNLVTNSSDRLVRMDIFFVSQIVARATSFLNTISFSQAKLQNLVVIYNNLMQVDYRVARSSAAFNSTNVLLHSLDMILIYGADPLLTSLGNAYVIDHLTDISDTSETIRYGATISKKHRGIIVDTSPMLINFIIDPKLTDVSGVALLKLDKSSRFGFDATGLENYSVQYLYRNQSLTDLLFHPDLHVASFLPNELLLDILTTNPDAKLIFSIFYNDVLFQTFDNTTHIKSDGKIIAVSIPGLSQLPGFLPIYLQPEDSIDDYCGYWDFHDTDGWSETGCLLTAQNPVTKIVLCECDHLTHFAYLLKGSSSQLEEIHLRSLQKITVLGCSLSLIGIFGIFLTAIQFRSWRSKTSTKYLLQLSTAIAFQMILIAFVNTAPMTQWLLLTNNEAWCIVIGVLLHYFVLAMFFWMLIIAYLQFIRYVIVFSHVKTKRFLLKSSILGWTLPMIPVLLVASIDSGTYIPDLELSESQICYPSGYSLYFGILLPIGVIVGANIVIFILVNYNLLRGSNAVCRAGDRNTKLSQLRLSIFLFFLLGLTWIFGLMSTAFAETSVVFSYLFCLTSTFQGFVMFIYFVIMDPVARNLWIFFFKRLCFGKRGNIDIRKDPTSKDSY